MALRNSFREIAAFMDDRFPATTFSKLSEQHLLTKIRPDWVSFRDILDKHSAKSIDVPVLFYNTFLLTGFLGFGDSPANFERSYLIGKELRNSGYGIAGLCEVFEESFEKRIKQQSKYRHHEVGPVSSIFNKSSGLMTLSRYPITKFSRRKFETGGSGWDSMANKGVLYTQIDLGIGKIDLYTTHLSYGSAASDDDTKKDFEDRTKERLGQLKELTKFIGETHNPAHVIIVAGDMNINAAPKQRADTGYSQMKSLLDKVRIDKDKSLVSLIDLWPLRGGNKGGTNHVNKCTREHRLVEGKRVYCDDDFVKTVEDEGRIDYMFVQKPVPSHALTIDFTRMKRRPFPVPSLNNEDMELVSSYVLSQPAILLKIGISAADLMKGGLGILDAVNQAKLIDLVNSELRRKIGSSGMLSDHLGIDVTFVVNKNTVKKP